MFKLNELKIERWIGTSPSITTQLHGFCDASEAAYGAVIYARCLNNLGNIVVHLISSKTKVAPVQQLTLPRLELCAATLLARLMKSVQKSLKLKE